MKIIAESKPVVGMPFVHLGYLAASYVKPLGGLLVTGSLLAVLGIGMAFRLVAGKNRRGAAQTEVSFRKSRIGAIGMGALLVGLGCVVVAWKLGGRYYPHGNTMTALKMQRILEGIEMLTNNTSAEPVTGLDIQIKDLPTEAGEYDLAAVVQQPVEPRLFADGWNVPMKLKVVAVAGQKPSYRLMSAGQDGQWNTPDDFTSQKFEEMWRGERQ